MIKKHYLDSNNWKGKDRNKKRLEDNQKYQKNKEKNRKNRRKLKEWGYFFLKNGQFMLNKDFTILLMFGEKKPIKTKKNSIKYKEIYL